jgi:two-component system response regulator YesN
MKLRSSSFLLRLLLLTIFIGTLPVISLGIFAYYNASQTVQDKVNEGNKQLLQQMQMRAEQTLKTIDNSATQLLQSSVVTRAFDNEITNADFELVHELYQGISRIQTYELGIQDVFLYSLKKKWIVSSDGVGEYSVPEFKPQLEAFSQYEGGSFWTRLADESQSGTRNAVYFVKKYPFNSVNPTGIICVVLSTDTMKDMFLTSQHGAAFILDREGASIVHRADDPEEEGMPTRSYLATFAESEALSGQYPDKRNGEGVTVTFRRSSYNGWSYVSVSSNEEASRQNAIIGWITLLVSLGILLLTLIVAWFGSRRMYGPIRNLYSALTSFPSPDVSASQSGELQVIGERVDYLIRNQSLIMNELKGQQSQLKEFFAQKLFSGTIHASDFEEKLSLYGLEKTWPSMCVFAIHIDTLTNTRYEEGNRDLLMFAINNIVGELVLAEQRLEPLVQGDYQVTLLGARQEGAAFKEWVFSLCDEIQKAISQYLDIKVSIGISRSFGSFRETPQALHDAMAALKYRVGLGEESILFIEDVQPQKSSPHLFPSAGEMALLDAIRSGNEEQSRAALIMFLEELFQPQSQHRDYQLSLLRLLIDLLKFGQELSIPPDRITENEASLIQSLFKLRNVGEMEQWFWSLFVFPYLQELGERRDNQFKMISEAVIDMIKLEYDSVLTLEECASRINYHPHYVSRVFRQETGINFSDYLAQHRMDMARKWLKESDMKIAEIAERLQYNNSANFIRSFRKYAGMTPGQYREEG